MVRLVAYLLTIALIATGLAWLADRPGTLQIAWQGYDIETSVFRAVVLLAAAVAAIGLLWSVFRAVWNSPAAVGDRMVKRRQKKGLDALSSGLIAVGAGDAALASRFALQARKSLPHEPLTHLLRAQSAELAGDRATARRIYEAMLASPETEQLGLRGLSLRQSAKAPAKRPVNSPAARSRPTRSSAGRRMRYSSSNASRRTGQARSRRLITPRRTAISARRRPTANARSCSRPKLRKPRTTQRTKL